MPAVTAHYLFGQAVLKKMEGAKIETIAATCPGAFNIGTQGPDIMFFALGDKQMNKWGDEVHSGASALYQATMSFTRAQAPSWEKDAFLAYMAGFLCHYALDCSAHPYIFYRSGFSDEDGGLAKQGERRHRLLESIIDAVVVEKITGKDMYEMNIGKVIELSGKERKAISAPLANCMRTAFGYDRDPADFAKGMKDMSFVYKVLRDKNGKKKKALEIVDLIIRDHGLLSALVGAPYDEDIDWINEERSTWTFPWDDSIEMNFSFHDLFNRAAEDAVIYISAYCKAVFKEMDPKIALSIIGGKNFSTGLEFPVKFKHCDEEFIKNISQNYIRGTGKIRR
ncbi:MAG: zinc dependent phospholipase C family protein [Clostridiales bacterium]|jgi:hypothetical protein|nr:zinc dependent phospholipase C family protein [Clostridiales bacterium]MDR2750760.1 zinc dependent phospholipase C family protein [Clostridiales bacterium]